jgi:hypothetical protein
MRKSILAGVIAALISAPLNYAILGYFERSKHKEIEQMRKELQGFWLLETNTVKTSKTDYQDMRIIHVLILTVDDNFSVHGVAYKGRERSRKGEIVYRREDRARAEITGSVIQPRIILNWESNDYQGRASIQTFEGSVNNQNGQTLVRGEFFNDVASQIGTFCAKKVDLGALEMEESLPSEICKIVAEAFMTAAKRRCHL